MNLNNNIKTVLFDRKQSEKNNLAYLFKFWCYRYVYRDKHRTL